MLHYTVAVRALCEFTAKQGDLDVRFTPSPTAQEGIEGHQWVAARRGAGFETELALSGEHGALRVRGRADGYDAAANRLEEVKTFRGRLERQPANHRHLHWAQLKVYGWLLCQARGLEEVDLALVYFNVGSQDETVFTERWAAAALRAHFEARCEAFVAWAALEMAHRSARDQALRSLAFPHAAFRHGQRALAEAVYKVARAGRCLMAQAPTGIGKTVGSLFPLLKACPDQALDKVFFLTAKTSGRALALEALARIGGAGGGGADRSGAGSDGSAGHGGGEAALPLRVLELVARDKACEHPGQACHGEACPLARGFYDRLPAAREAALALPVWHKAGLRALALHHAVCPYYLGQELARWSDVVVGDYNHFFDVSAMLHALTAAQRWRVGLLVDEAHNLVERGRKMYSAELSQASLKQARRDAPAALKKPLERLQRRWSELDKQQPGGPAGAYQVLPALPETFMLALQQAATAIVEHLAEQPAEPGGPLQSFYFEALHFGRLAESFGEHSLLDLARGAADAREAGGVGRSGVTGVNGEKGEKGEKGETGARRAARGGSLLCLRNVVPAGFLRPRFAAAHTATLFSATLQPQHYYREMLGLPDNTAWIDVESPFTARQLSVQVARDISTRYSHRHASLEAIVERIASQFAQRPGNYLAFFSSFEHLQQVARRFEAKHPTVPAWPQARGMGEPAQAAFLERFVCGGQGVGFVVLGGSFAEGIDLPGERLIGAFIASLGLPQVNPVNEQIRRRLEQLCGAGFDYTYLFPGLQKVVQAAGRVIRTPTDSGVVHLLDDRFLRPEVQALLPAWWAGAQKELYERRIPNSVYP